MPIRKSIATAMPGDDCAGKEVMPMCVKILCGDALEQLRTLDSNSVDMCVTSPPY